MVQFNFIKIVLIFLNKFYNHYQVRLMQKGVLINFQIK